MVKDVESYLQQQTNKNNEFLDEWSKMHDFFSKRLWHQLTLLVQKTLSKSEFKAKTNLTEMYDNFISDFEHRINPLSLAEMIISVSEQIMEKDPAEAIILLEKIKEKVTENSEAKILCSTAVGMIKLTRQQDLPGTREVIESTERNLEELQGVSSVHARFYMLSSLYQQTVGNKALFYREALRYLGCTELDKMPMDERRRWAVSLSLAALLGEDIYNFGELLMHEVLSSLKETEESWLVDLVLAFNRGSMESLDTLASKWRKQSDLAGAENFLRQKMMLMCLMEMIFRRPANQRTFTLAEIGQATQVSDDEVELLVMRALSKSLIKGRIDEVGRTVALTWVQPRVLDLDQISSMQSRLKQWTSSVVSTRSLVEVHAKEILT